MLLLFVVDWCLLSCVFLYSCLLLCVGCLCMFVVVCFYLFDLLFSCVVVCCYSCLFVVHCRCVEILESDVTRYVIGFVVGSSAVCVVRCSSLVVVV